MNFGPILCPVDFSEPSRAALVYAAALAEQYRAPLIVLAVDDPFLVEAAAIAGLTSLEEQTRRELRRVCHAVLGDRPDGMDVDVRVAAGKPAVEILREARRARVGLIVMSSRGYTGVRKMFFGSTTEAVLRETTVPVLVTPAGRQPVRSFADFAPEVGHVLAPLDLSDHSPRQLAIAADIACTLAVPLLIVHVLETVAIPFRLRVAMSGIDTARRARAEERMQEMIASLPPALPREALVLSGEPADEIVKFSDARRVGLIVMGLHSSEPPGPRMGTVTYRVLCLTRALVLALPPGLEASVPRPR